MSFDDILKITTLIISTFGGGALILIALASWLGNLWAKRILHSEKAKIDSQLESIRHELGITRSSYEHHLDLILDYYASFYNHYRLCQRTAYADAHKELPDGEIVYTRDEFFEKLGDFLKDWANKEGRIRLLLPAKLLKVHEEAVEKFNEFKRAVYDFTTAEPIPRKKEVVFKELDDIKARLENGLRDFLRTESLLK
jgi:DNA-binding transcriptional ArsR family regulator